MMDRRQFSTLAGASLGSLLTRRLWAEQARATASPDKFYFALVADTHIIDEFYVKGSENGVEDNESILLTTPRFISARDLINSLHPAIEQVFLIGDYFHNYPSADYDFYFKNTTRLDNAKIITDGFKMPVHLGFGNHDYDVKRVSREMSHRLFEARSSIRSRIQPWTTRVTNSFTLIIFLAARRTAPRRIFIRTLVRLGKSSSTGSRLSFSSTSLPSSSSTIRSFRTSQPSSPITACILSCANTRTPFSLWSQVTGTSGLTIIAITVRNTTSWLRLATTPTPTC